MKCYIDENGRECSKCREYKVYFDVKTLEYNFYIRKGKYNSWCIECEKLCRGANTRNKNRSNVSKSKPLIRGDTSFCHKHQMVKDYFNSKGNKICRRCNIVWIINAHRRKRHIDREAKKLNNSISNNNNED